MSFTSQPCIKCGCPIFEHAYKYKHIRNPFFARPNWIRREEDKPDHKFICTNCNHEEIIPHGSVVIYKSDGFISRYGDVRHLMDLETNII